MFDERLSQVSRIGVETWKDIKWVGGWPIEETKKNGTGGGSCCPVEILSTEISAISKFRTSLCCSTMSNVCSQH